MVRTISTNVSRAIVARLFPGEDILPTLEKIVTQQKIKSGQLTLIGAISGARLGYFDFGNKVYTDFTVDEDLEVVSCMGNISRTIDDNVVVHAHMIVSDEKGRCYGGHLMPGCKVSVTIEVVIFELDIDLRRARDRATGLNLLDIK